MRIRAARGRTLLAASFVAMAAASAPCEVVTVKAGRLVDSRAGSVSSNAVIVIENGRVRAVGPALPIPAGARVMEAIRSATISAAELIGSDREIGSLEPGKWADLIGVKGDPLQDIRVLEDVSYVMREGRVYKDAR